jgi:Uma2 family endonuclease
MSAMPRPQVTPEQYLNYERASNHRHEYLDGEILAMVGASRNHNLIVQNLGLIINTQIRDRGCESYANEMRVGVNPARMYAHPDFVLVCGTPEFDAKEQDTLLNPTVFVEVLSPSTESCDNSAKAELYRAVPSLQDYLIVVQDRLYVMRYARQSAIGWLLTEHTAPDVVLTLDSINCTLPMADIYQKVTFA